MDLRPPSVDRARLGPVVGISTRGPDDLASSSFERPRGISLQPRLQLRDGHELASAEPYQPDLRLDMFVPEVPAHAERFARLVDAERQTQRSRAIYGLSRHATISLVGGGLPAGQQQLLAWGPCVVRSCWHVGAESGEGRGLRPAVVAARSGRWCWRISRVCARAQPDVGASGHFPPNLFAKTDLRGRLSMDQTPPLRLWRLLCQLIRRLPIIRASVCHSLKLL